MNPLEAVEAVSGARAPLATLQALADSLAALAPQGPGLAEESAAPRGDTAAQAAGAAPAVPEAVLPVQHAEAATAAQGRLTLGQLASEQAALRAAPEAAAGESARMALRAEPLAEAGSHRIAELLAVPVLLTPLHPPAAPPLRPPEAETPLPRRTALHDDADDEPAPQPGDDDAATAGDPAPEAADAEADAPAAALHALLQRAQQAPARADLARGRRVLVVLPAEGAAPGIAPATAWLLGATRAQRFVARWWPGAAHAGDPRWLQWRVFRDGDPLLARGLASRAGGAACRVRLGAQPLRLADADAAGLDIGDRIRFAQALGGQWSLLVLAAPAGTAP